MEPAVVVSMVLHMNGDRLSDLLYNMASVKRAAWTLENITPKSPQLASAVVQLASAVPLLTHSSPPHLPPPWRHQGLDTTKAPSVLA
eukprot:4000286-Pyramimonas_sp.AAC.1